jgi:aminopeptidase
LEVEKINAALTILGTHNTRSLSSVNPERIALQKKSGAQLTRKILDRIAGGDLRWCITQFPTFAAAQDADLSLTEYEDFLYSACALDQENPVQHWRELADNQQRYVEFLSRAEWLHLKGPDADLKFSVKGRHWINCAGKENFPDGEVFTAPLEESVNGHIHFSFPAVYQNREVQDVRLTFKDGQVVKAEAGKGLDLLRAMIEVDDGAAFVGEFAFGTNRGITRFTRNTLFDEKIGGTVHLALGASLPESGGKNQSSIHWDMVCDLRSGGEVRADDELFYRDGEFLL